MYKHMRTGLFRTLIPAVLAVMLFPMTAFAAQTETAGYEVSVPLDQVVELTVDGRNIPSDASYSITLEAENGAPMPAEAEGKNPYTVTVTAAGAVDLGTIVYTVPEDYVYKITQTTEDRSYFTYDRAEYEMTVRVVNGENGQEGNLEREIWLREIKDGSAGGDKAEKAVFANSYYKSSGGGGGGGGGGGTTPGKPINPDYGPGVPQPGDGDGLVEPEPATPQIIPGGLPKTGDTTHAGLWMALMAVSGAALLVTIIGGRRKDEGR